MTVVQIDHVKLPSDLTSDLLTSIITQHYDFDSSKNNVSSLDCRPLGRGVMSNVQILNVTYASSHSENLDSERNTIENNAANFSVPNRFLVKFQKPEIPMPDLFTVEGEFYRLVDKFNEEFLSGTHDSGDDIIASRPFPFRIVEAIATGPNWLLLQYIPKDKVTTMDVTSGCPPDKFDELVVMLAKMHAWFWIGTDSKQMHQLKKKLPTILTTHSRKLSSTPGVGHNLPIQDRQASFANSWPAVRSRLLPFFPSESKEYLQQLDRIVEWTAQSPRIEKIANSVGEKKFTLIHGDFHVGNILFPKLPSYEGDEDEVWRANENPAKNTINERAARRPWLVDWSMSGIGNPLVDLVFFLVVGADIIPSNAHPDKDPVAITSESLEKVLNKYHRALNSNSRTNVETLNDSTPVGESLSRLDTLLLSSDETASMFRQCLLNQFIILVCYDHLCRSMAETSPDEQSKKLLHSHFDRVNVRCVNMLLSKFGWREDIIL
ncbi:hypothetical protein ACHAXS_003947 [Conticribra weissflogii]